MAESSWPSPAASRVVDDIQYEKLGATMGVFHGVMGDFTSPQLIYGDSSGRQIKVAADRHALVRGHVWWSGSSIVTKAIAANSSGSTRIDLIVLRLSRTTWDVTCEIVAGTPGAGAPNSTQNTGTTGVWEMVLALVTVTNGAATITAGNVQYVAPHMDPVGGRVRVPLVSYPWAAWSTFTGSEVMDATGAVVRWNGTAYTAINDVYRVASGSLTADTATWNATESGALLTVVAPLINGHTYGIRMNAAVASDAAAAAESAVVRVHLDTAAGTQILGPQVYLPATGVTGYALGAYAEYVAAATGNKSFVLTGQRNGGSGNQKIVAATSRPTWVTIDHVG